MQPTGVVRHPNKPSISVTVRKPKRSEIYDESRQVAATRKPIAVQTAAGEILRDKRGEPVVRIMTDLESLASMAARLKTRIVAIENVADEDGNTLILGPAFDARVFWDEHLDVSLEHCGYCRKGKDESIHDLEAKDLAEDAHRYDPTITYARFINEAIAEGKIFDADPTVTGSVSQ